VCARWSDASPKIYQPKGAVVSSTVQQSRVDGVLHIRLNRPEKFNAMSDEMFDALLAAAEDARDSTDLRAVVLSGAGKSFCAGLDFAVHRRFADQGAAGRRPFADPNDPDSPGAPPGREQRIVRALRDVKVPVIAAVQGHAIGGGLQLALGADIRMVTPDAQLSFAEIDFGMTVDMGGSQLLPGLVGRDRAMDLLLTGRTISGVLAAQWGLATRLSDDPLAEATDMARTLATRNPFAITHVKRLVRLTETTTVEEGMREELSVMARNIGSPAQTDAVERYFANRTSAR
jgi:enoyl-CoA hydratase/carnithine racemase